MSKVQLSTVLARHQVPNTSQAPPPSHDLDLSPRFQEAYVEREDWDSLDDTDIHGVRRASRARKI